ncbi:rhodanese-like domain-containing protein [Vibrio variabilis]|uniref:rhodanese-like domain-containing protein n=1 Tax=Vibrio variabilis TaxID=990271 RepID=UPI000DD90710|nr:rhodanese-like domain-containing protein [Vibrio variabilis]
MKVVFRYIVLSLLFVLGAAHASDRAKEGWQMIEQGAMVIDVRTPEEFNAGHLDQAVNYPLSELDKHIAALDKSQPIVLYCRSGNRSGQALAYMESKGFTALHNAGGLNEMKIESPQ